MSETRETRPSSTHTTILHKTIFQLLSLINQYTGEFEGIKFYSRSHLIEKHEELFRQLTLEYSQEEDFSLDLYLKKILMGEKKGMRKLI